VKGPIESIIDYSERRNEEPGPTYDERLRSKTEDELITTERGSLAAGLGLGFVTFGGVSMATEIFASSKGEAIPDNLPELVAGGLVSALTVGAAVCALEQFNFWRRARRIRRVMLSESPDV
jgi:hypothetical protein